MNDQEKRRSSMGDEVREGLRAGLGILSALKDAIEETVEDMMERGELSPERAREAVRTTMDRAQSAFDDARMRLDFVPRREFDALAARVAALEARLDQHAGAADAHHEHGPGSGEGNGPDIPITEG